MGGITDKAADVYRDSQVAGVPASGPNEPVKSDIRALFAFIEAVITSAGAGVQRFATIAARDASTPPADGTIAYVYANNGSSSDAANGYYQYRNGAWEAAPWFLASFSDAAATVFMSRLDKLYPNLWPELLVFGAGRCLIDWGNTFGGGANKLYIPTTLTARKGSTNYGGTFSAASGEGGAAVLAGYVAMNVDPNGLTVIWADGRSGVYRSTSADGFIANLIDNPGGAFDKAIIIAVVRYGQIVSPVEVFAADQGIGRNRYPFTFDMESTPLTYNRPVVGVDVVSPALRALGYIRGIRTASSTDYQAYAGTWLSKYRKGDRFFARIFVDAPEDNLFAPGAGWDVNFFGGGDYSSPYGSITARLERIYDARGASFVVEANLPFDIAQNAVFIFGTNSGDIQKRFTIAGLQYDDDPDTRYLLPTDPGPDLIVPPTIFVRSGTDITINPANGFSSINAAQGMMFGVDSLVPDGTASTAVTIEGRSAGTLVADKLGTTAQLVAMEGPSMLAWRSRTIAIRKGGSTSAVTLLCMGDSRTNRQLGLLVQRLAAARGQTVTLVGTQNNQGIDGNGNPGGTSWKGEGREGWEWADFIYLNTRFNPVAPANRRPDYAVPMNENPFIRPATSQEQAASDAAGAAGQFVFNGYIVDIAAYLADFVIATPGIWPITLGTNDWGNNADDATALAHINTGMRVFVSRIRAALPTVKIGLGSFAMGHPDFLNVKNARNRRLVIGPTIDFVAARQQAGDGNIYHLPFWFHENRVAGWDVTTLATDKHGTITARTGENVHERIPNKLKCAQVVDGFVAST